MADILSFPVAPTEAPIPPVPFFDLTAQYATISEEVQEAVARLFSDQKFILGEEVAELECAMAAYCDARAAVGCASGTDALILALMALDIGPGDEVITSPFTFFATASSIRRVGARPVFVDIDPVTFNLDPEGVAAAITERTRAIMPVHLYGQCADMEPLWRLAVRHHLAIVEDACQAIGAEYRGRRAGVLGTVGCFSFFPTKNLGGAGDGGLVTTDDLELATRLRRLRVHGDAGGYKHLEIGLNSRLDALQAAVLRIKLRKLETWTEQRRTNADRYAQLISHYNLDQLVPPTVAAERRHVFNQYVIRIPESVGIRGSVGKRDSSETPRDRVLKTMKRAEMGAAVYYPTPLHLQECFRSLGYREGMLPRAEQASREVLALPIFPELTAAQQERVIRGLASALGSQTRKQTLFADVSTETTGQSRAA